MPSPPPSSDSPPAHGHAHGDAPGADREGRVATEPERVRRAQLVGLVRGLPRPGPQEPCGDPQRVPAGLRHDPLLRPGRVHRQQEAALALQLLQGRAPRRSRRDLRARHPAHAPGERAAERGPALRHRAARDPAARPGRQLEVDHRASHQARAGRVLAHARGRALHLRLGAPRGAPPRGGRVGAVQVPDARGAAAPDPGRVARQGAARAGHQLGGQDPGAHRRRPRSGVPPHLPRAHGPLQGELDRGREAHSRAGA